MYFDKFDKFGFGEDRPRKLATPQPSVFKAGDMVRWVKGKPYDQTTLKEYRAKYGSGPLRVVSTTSATEEFVPPQVKLTTKDGEHVFGETWFVRVPNIGDTCEACDHKYERRTIFFSVDEHPSCWCP